MVACKPLQNLQAQERCRPPGSMDLQANLALAS